MFIWTYMYIWTYGHMSSRFTWTQGQMVNARMSYDHMSIWSMTICHMPICPYVYMIIWPYVHMNTCPYEHLNINTVQRSAEEAVAHRSAAPCLQGAGRSKCFWQTSPDSCSYLQTPKPLTAPASAADPASKIMSWSFGPPSERCSIYCCPRWETGQCVARENQKAKWHFWFFGFLENFKNLKNWKFLIFFSF